MTATHHHDASAPGYIPGAVLQDNCERCHDLATRGIEGLQHLPSEDFMRLWQMMLRPGLKPDASGADLIACGELCAVARALERHVGLDRYVISIAMMARGEDQRGTGDGLGGSPDSNSTDRLRRFVRDMWRTGDAR